MKRLALRGAKAPPDTRTHTYTDIGRFCTIYLLYRLLPGTGFYILSQCELTKGATGTDLV